MKNFTLFQNFLKLHFNFFRLKLGVFHTVSHKTPEMPQTYVWRPLHLLAFTAINRQMLLPTPVRIRTR